MGGEDVAIAAAGGMDDGATGTDAERVRLAVEQVRSPDGVLILMDLGSALMSAEMAVEMLDADGGQVVLCGAPLVEGAVAAAARARGGASLDEVAREARGALRMKTAQLGEEAPEANGGTSRLPDDTEALELRLRVEPRLGLHARPAARFAAAVSDFDARVEVRNATRSTGPADGRSLTGLAVLNARRGDELVVHARGEQAADALDALRALAAENFGDAVEEPSDRSRRGRARGGSRRRCARLGCAAARRRRIGGHRDRAGALAAGARPAGRRRAARVARGGARAPRRGPLRGTGGARSGARRGPGPRRRRRGRDLHRPCAAPRRRRAHRARLARHRRRGLRRAGMAIGGPGRRRGLPGARRPVPARTRGRRGRRRAAGARAARRHAVGIRAAGSRHRLRRRADARRGRRARSRRGVGDRHSSRRGDRACRDPRAGAGHPGGRRRR